MSDDEATETDEQLISKYLPPKADESLVAESLFTKRELAAYLLAERSNMTWEEAANAMGIGYGTYSGKMGNDVKRKKRRARATVELVDLIEG